MAKHFRILSIDGGGIRGILPAMLLAELERRTGKSSAELFDLVAGTSTGGIIALAITLTNEPGNSKYKAHDLVNLYHEHGERIFSRKKWHKVQSANRSTGVKYPTEGMIEVFEDLFGDTMLSNASIDVLITAYDIERQRPFFFRSSLARKDAASDFSLKEVACATSAAPIYFEPYRLETVDPVDYYALVDGLVFAGNPTMCAFAEAQGDSGGSEDMIVLSLGTGKVMHRQTYKDVREWRALEWSENILHIVLHGVSLTVHHQMKRLLPVKNGLQRYYRFQAELDQGSEKMDDVNPTNIRNLKLLAEEIISERTEDIDRLCEALTR